MQVGYVYGPMGMLSQISGGQTFAYLHNLQGSTVALVDGSGNVRNNYRYDPFGKKLTSSTEQILTSFTHLGRFSVPTVDQYSVMAFRLYEARQGRFTGTDPFAYLFALSMSPYIYADESPIGFGDPSGLMSIPVGTAGSTPVSILNLNDDPTQSVWYQATNFIDAPTNTLTGAAVNFAENCTVLNSPWNCVPRSGNYCGPNWSGGQDTQTLNGHGDTSALSPLDQACRVHDAMYRAAEQEKDSWVAAKIREDADRMLADAAAQYAGSLGNAYENAYAGAAAKWFPVQATANQAVSGFEFTKATVAAVPGAVGTVYQKSVSALDSFSRSISVEIRSWW
jgi:RHS repeat-associated protein